MADNSSPSNLLTELAKACRMPSKKKFFRALVNNKPSNTTTTMTTTTTNNTNNTNTTITIFTDNDKDVDKKAPYEFKLINKGIKYAFPSRNDDEFARLNLEHCLLRFLWQSNFSSPMEQRLLSGGIRVLDVGCGSGAWVLDMAREYHPSNTYIGIDILPNLPDDDTRLPNTGFMRCNLLDGIPFPDSTFDFVYERFIVHSDLTEAQWQSLFSEMKRVLKPGGYLEIMEYRVGFDNPGPITQARNAQVLKYLNSKGINPETTVSSIPQMMQSSLSLSNFQRQDKLCQIGRWGGEFGSMMLDVYEKSRKTLNVLYKSDLTEDEAREFDNYKTQIGSVRCFAQKNGCSFGDS